MIPVQVSGQAIGTAISVTDSTALAALPQQGLAVGTRVWNSGVGAFFTYTISTASLVSDRVVAVAGVAGARWIIVDNPVAYPTVTLNAENTTVTVSGLNGDTDGDYLIEFFLDGHVNAPGNVKFQINGADTNLGQSIGNITAAGTVSQVYSASVCLLGNIPACRLYGRIILKSASGGAERPITVSMYGDYPLQVYVCGLYADTTTNITSVSIVGANANCFESGSWLKVTALHDV